MEMEMEMKMSMSSTMRILTEGCWRAVIGQLFSSLPISPRSCARVGAILHTRL